MLFSPGEDVEIAVWNRFLLGSQFDCVASFRTETAFFWYVSDMFVWNVSESST